LHSNSSVSDLSFSIYETHHSDLIFIDLATTLTIKNTKSKGFKESENSEQDSTES